MTTGATREEVLAWMRETGCGHSRAAAHFGVNAETVKSWAKRAAPKPPPSRPHAVAKAQHDPKTDAAEPAAPSSRAKAPPAQDMAPALKRASQMAVAHRLAFLARADSMHHKDAKSIALQLKLLVEATPDALVQATEAAPTGQESLDAELAIAFGITPADLAKPILTPIVGGRASHG